MPSSRKQVAFDLDTKALEKYYPMDSWRNAYQDIRRDMTDNGFLWQQGSVYTSEKSIPNSKVTDVITRMVEAYPWLNVCMRDCVVTNIGKEHNKNNLFDKTVEIPERSNRPQETGQEIEIDDDRDEGR